MYGTLQCGQLSDRTIDAVTQIQSSGLQNTCSEKVNVRRYLNGNNGFCRFVF